MRVALQKFLGNPLLFLCHFYYVVFCDDGKTAENMKDKIEKYVGIFSNYIGSNMWAWVAVVAGSVFVLCLVLWLICSLICCICGSRKK